MGHDQQLTVSGEAYGYPSLLEIAVILIRNPLQDLSLKDRGSKVETNLVVPKIARRLGWIPLKLRLKHAVPFNASTGRMTVLCPMR